MKNENELEGPTFFYDPVSRQGQVFTSMADVPKGWVDSLEPVSDTVEHDGMSRDEITGALAEGGVKFRKNESTTDLHGKLRGALEKALTDNDVAIPPDATVPDLLQMVGNL